MEKGVTPLLPRKRCVAQLGGFMKRGRSSSERSTRCLLRASSAVLFQVFGFRVLGSGFRVRAKDFGLERNSLREF